MTDDGEELGTPPGCLQVGGTIAAVVGVVVLVLVGLVLFTCRF